MGVRWFTYDTRTKFIIYLRFQMQIRFRLKPESQTLKLKPLKCQRPAEYTWRSDVKDM